MKIQKCRLLAILLASLLPACATRSKVPSGAPGDDLRGYVGQQRVLRFQGDRARVEVKAKGKPQLPGSCDAAVEVRSAARDKAGARLVLEAIGAARAETARPACREIPPIITVAFKGFAGDRASVTRRLEQILPTPEGYLRAYGVVFDRPPGPAPTLFASGPEMTGATMEEERLERRITAPARRLFWVDPIHRDPRRAVRYEGEAQIEGVVGGDGRLHRPRVRGSLDRAHVASIERAVPMWRFEPARAGEEPIASHVVSRLVFRIR